MPQKRFLLLPIQLAGKSVRSRALRWLLLCLPLLDLTVPSSLSAGTLILDATYSMQSNGIDKPGHTMVQTHHSGSGPGASDSIYVLAPNGGDITTELSMSASEGSAEFRVNSQYSAYDYDAVENYSAFSFTLARPATFNLTATYNDTKLTNIYGHATCCGYAGGALYVDQREAQDILGRDNGVTDSASGKLAKGAKIGFYANTGANPVYGPSGEIFAPVKGSAGLSLTLTEIPNRPPVLARIENRIVEIGGFLSFATSATDGDVPPDNLTFSLEGAPAGASINPSTGVFFWMPTEDQALQIYTMTVRVTDDGIPALSDSKSFKVAVCKRDEFGKRICAEPAFDPSFKGNGPPNCCEAVGEPISVGSGNMFYEIVDYKTASSPPLTLSRYYNSLGNTNAHKTMFGVGWRSTYDRYLRFYDPSGAPLSGSYSIAQGSSVVVERADGREIRFVRKNSEWVPDSDVGVRFAEAGDFATVTDEDDTVELYPTPVAQGVPPLTIGPLGIIQYRGGYSQKIGRGPDGPVSVTDSYGRMFHFEYENGSVKTFSGPDGFRIDYSYTRLPVTGENRLSAIAYPMASNATQQYAYQDWYVTFPEDHTPRNLRAPLSSIVDENGTEFAHWFYDETGRGLSSTLGDSVDLNTVQYNRSEEERIVGNPLGLSLSYQFKTVQNVPKLNKITRIETADVRTATLERGYDANGYIASQKDWNGNLTVFERESRGMATNIVEAAGTPQERLTQIAYHSKFHLPVRIVAPGKTTDFVYNGTGNLLSRTETDTSTNTVPYSTAGEKRLWSYTVNHTGQILTATGPRTDLVAITQNTYETNGNLTSGTDALGHVTRFTAYNGRGLPLELVDENGVTNRFAYHERGWLTNRQVFTSRGVANTGYFRDAVGQVIVLRMPDGAELRYGYDSAHRLRSVSNLLGESIVYTLDAAGNITRRDTRDSNGVLARTQRQEFDRLSRLLREIGAASQTNGYGYDANGNVTSFADGFCRTNLQAFDGLDRLVSAVDPLKNLVGTAYDPQDSLVSVSDPRTLTTSYVRDGFGRIIQENSPDKGVTTYRLDEAGNRVSETDARGVVTLRGFDALDRVIWEKFPASPVENIAYSYDSIESGNRGVGRLTGFSDETGSTVLVYNEQGDVVRSTRAIGGKSYDTRYAYDLADHVIGITYPSGHVLTYGRDAMGRIASITLRQSAASNPTLLADKVAYRPFGPLMGFTYGNGLARSHSFDFDYRLTGIVTASGTATVQNLAMSYDVANNITSISNLLDSSRNQVFSYDADYRLTGATGSYGTIGYGYDPVGNRLWEVSGGVSNRYSYPPTANRLESVKNATGTRSFAYTAGGNISTESSASTGERGFTYNNRNRLSNFTLGGNLVATYQYNAFGQRLVKKVGETTTHFHYDQQSRLIAESDGATGAMIREYIWLDGMPLAQIEADGTLYFIHPDHLNTPQKVTDAGQSVVWDREQKPFGETVAVTTGTTPPKLTGAGFNKNGQFTFSVGGEMGSDYVIQVATSLGEDIWSSVNTNTAPFVFTDSSTTLQARFYRVVSALTNEGTTGITQDIRFPGQYFDTESNLHYNLTRNFDPALGRYVHSDLVGLLGGINIYVYCGSNPSRWADSFGLAVFPGDPSDLGPGWKPDPTHRDPNGERFRNSDGEYIDFHRGRPNLPGNRGKNHWHKNGGSKHFEPGDEIPSDSEKCPTSEPPSESTSPSSPRFPFWMEMLEPLIRYPFFFFPGSMMPPDNGKPITA